MNDALRWILAIVVLSHGIGHVLFMPLLFGAMRLQASGDSWLLTPALGGGPTRLVASIAAAAALAAFAAAAAGIVLQASWWRPVALVGAAVSIAVVVLMWNGLQSSSAMAALAFDVVVLVALLVVRWPSPELIGS
jgi:hypothetical protein